MRNEFIVFAILSTLIIGCIAYFLWPPILWAFLIFGPLIFLGFYDMVQSKHAIIRNFPILGRGRYVMEELRPKIYQYFIESDTNGAPISRIFRSIVYARSKKELSTTPFGTQLDVYAEGYEWMNHSIAPIDPHQVDHDPRVTIGGKDCKHPYHCSIFNVSAMSFGSLSSAAIEALNGGAKIGGFAHNTGEGGISPYHKKPQGDLIYQVGTGYFGCRAKDGNFDPEAFAERTASDQVKMIELKISQGAKPGHGGILPAKKNTKEISEIRGIDPGEDVLSPPYHKAFSTPTEMMEFLGQMRTLSGGKPIGFKLCVGSTKEFFAICKAMLKTGIKPDFISVDGGEGGTGAAPLEFSNSVGMPFREGLAFVHNALQGFGLREEIKLIASGKIITGFHIFRAKAIGADVCYSARAMMLALGCIQALECNQNTCPTGVATMDPELVSGLSVDNKKVRVANFHKETINSFVELQSAAGLKNHERINRKHVYRRITMNMTKRYDEIYPYIPVGSLLQKETIPEPYRLDWMDATAEHF